MTFLVASIEHHARVLANAVKRALVEKCSGFSDYEAADFYEGTVERGKTYRVRPGELTMFGRIQDADGFWVDAAELQAECEAEQEVAEPTVGTQCRAPHPFACLLCRIGCTYKTPTAGQRGENPAGDDSPTSPAGSPDPSPTSPPASQPRVGDEGSPAEIATFARRPAGERPTWVDWAVPAICDVLALHGCVYNEDAAIYECWDEVGLTPHASFGDAHDWREHVAPLIAERLGVAMESAAIPDAFTHWFQK
jgi:hypothetical protein